MEKSVKKKRRPALTPEARENQMISLAINLAERQLEEGTASSQVITHFLKLGTEKERLERSKIEHENELLKAKTEALHSAKHVEEMFEGFMDAMRQYGGFRDAEEVD